MKMNELYMLLDDLISCGQKLTETAQALKEYYSSTNEDVPAKEEPKAAEPEPIENAPAEAEVKTYTKEDVRALLSQKAKLDGSKYKSEVKSLVAKYSSDGTLTKVPEESYADLVADLEVVGNG